MASLEFRPYSFHFVRLCSFLVERSLSLRGAFTIDDDVIYLKLR